MKSREVWSLWMTRWPPRPGAFEETGEERGEETLGGRKQERKQVP